MNEALKVKTFTEESSGIPCPSVPRVMTKEEVFFLAKMMLDEIEELTATVAGPEASKTFLKQCIDRSKSIEQIRYNDQVVQIADQADALVDAHYYAMNAAAKCGINLAPVFDTVHAANLAKRDPASGVYLKRPDGKIMKPASWRDPDVVSVISKQLLDGSWSF